MPSYLSHAIMGEEVYKNAKSGNIFYIPISNNELRAYSLGTDLASISKKLNNDPHNQHTQAFFLNMIKYIKENNLIDNSHVIALLYGHIAHYFLDINAHPFIYYIESGCKKTSIIPNHYLIEGYLDAYLSKIVLNKDICNVNTNYFSIINLSDINVINLLNNIYGKTYNDSNIINTYKKTIIIFKKLLNTINNKFISKKQLIAFSKFNEFMKKNNLTKNELTNEDNLNYINPFTGEKHNESFIELYNKAITMTLDALIRVNSYLYGKTSLSSLENVFTDLSYDTGAKCNIGKKLIYVRKR